MGRTPAEAMGRWLTNSHCAMAIGVAMTCVAVVAQGRWHVSRHKESGPGTGLGYLTDHQLLRAWQHTSRSMSSVSPPLGDAAFVMTRQYLLDEIWARGLHTTQAL